MWYSLVISHPGAETARGDSGTVAEEACFKETEVLVPRNSTGGLFNGSGFTDWISRALTPALCLQCRRIFAVCIDYVLWFLSEDIASCVSVGAQVFQRVQP